MFFETQCILLGARAVTSRTQYYKTATKSQCTHPMLPVVISK